MGWYGWAADLNVGRLHLWVGCYPLQWTVGVEIESYPYYGGRVKFLPLEVGGAVRRKEPPHV